MCEFVELCVCLCVWLKPKHIQQEEGRVIPDRLKRSLSEGGVKGAEALSRCGPTGRSTRQSKQSAQSLEAGVSLHIKERRHETGQRRAAGWISNLKIWNPEGSKTWNLLRTNVTLWIEHSIKDCNQNVGVIKILSLWIRQGWNINAFLLYTWVSTSWCLTMCMQISPSLKILEIQKLPELLNL